MTHGQASDKTSTPIRLDGLPPCIVVADSGYDKVALFEREAAQGGKAHIPTQSRVRKQLSAPPDIHRRRNLIERFFCKLKQLHCIATCAKTRSPNFFAAVALASARVWLRELKSAP